MYQQQRRMAIWRTLLTACSKGELQLWVVKLLDLLVYTFHLWTLSLTLAPKQGYGKLVQAHLSEQVCWRQH